MMIRKYQLRTLRNLAVTALLLALLWWTVDCPLPTAEMELHRAERQRMMERSTVIFQYQDVDLSQLNQEMLLEDGFTVKNAYRDQLFDQPDVVVGVTDQHILFLMAQGRFCSWPRRQEGPTLVVLPTQTRYRTEDGFSLAPGLLAVDPPPLAESARLTLSLDYLALYHSDSSWPEHYDIEGVQLGPVFFFQLERHHLGDETRVPTGDTLEKLENLHFDRTRILYMDDHAPRTEEDLSSFYPYCGYTMEFFGADGELIQTVTG